MVIHGDVAWRVARADAEGRRLVRALDPELVWLAHTHEPW